MPSHIEACLASARRCSQIAKTTRTLDDRCEFLSFAASWQRLASEIESNQRLIALIDGLAARTPPGDEADPKFDELTKSHSSSVQRLATAILSVSHHFMADAVEAVADCGPVKQSSG
jgi:hypothetical protein